MDRNEDANHGCVERPLAGWGLHPVSRCRVYRPERRRDVETLLRAPVEGGVIARGLGRSYGDASLNAGGGVIASDRLSRMRRFDAENGRLVCEGGVSLLDIIRTFLPRGWFVPVTPGTQYVTIGGAIAADVHGKNHHRDGAFSSFVESLTLLTPAGEVITCSSTEASDVFWATVGGMGLTGVILEATLRMHPVESAYIAARTVREPNLGATFERFAELDDQYRYSVAWIDCLAGGSSLGRSVLHFGEHARPAELSGARAARPLEIAERRPLSVPFHAPGFCMNTLAVKVFNATYYAKNGSGTDVVEYDRFFHPLDRILHWNRLYGRRGFLQYQFVLPLESSRDGMTAALERLVAARAASFLAVLKRFGPANEGLLSFPTEGWTLAIDLPRRGARLERLLPDLDALVLDHGGRVYLAKDATLHAAAFERMYPHADRFHAMRRRLDPEGRLTSSLARRVGLVEGETP